MNCTNCGAPMQSGSGFCNNCGAPAAQPMQQQVVNQPVMQQQQVGQPMQQQPKKSSNILLIIMIIIIAALLILLVYLTVGVDKKDNSSNEPTTEENQPTEVAVNTTTLSLGNYSFKVPTEYVYKYVSNRLQISDNKTWVGSIQIINGNYNTIKIQKSLIKNNFQKAGYASNDPQIKTINGVEWIVVEINVNGKIHVVGYTKAGASEVFGIEVANTTGTADYNALEKVNTIIKSASSNGSTTNMSTSNNLIDIGLVK